MAAVAVTTHDLPTNPLGGLASVIDVSVAVVADETTARRLAALLAHEGLTGAVEADGARRLPDVCLHGPPHVAIVLWRSCGPEPAGALRYLRRQLARTRVIVVLTEPRRQDMRCAVDAAAAATPPEPRPP